MIEESDIKKCYSLLKTHNVWDDDYDILRKNFKTFALKNHPDKGGIKEVFQAVSSCKDILDNDFRYFKEVANKPNIYKEQMYNEEPIYNTYYSDDDVNDEDYVPESTKSKKSKTSKKSKKEKREYTHIDFETFIKKDCTGSRGGWLVTELRNFCKILGIDNKGTKGELCERLSKYFEEKETEKVKEWINEQYEEIDAEQKLKHEEELRRKKFDEEMKQREILERVHREQQRIREEEVNQLSDRMSKLSI